MRIIEFWKAAPRTKWQICYTSQPGIYTIKVAIAGYKFPTSKIGYRGEILKVLRPRILSLDIALDPVDKS